MGFCNACNTAAAQARKDCDWTSCPWNQIDKAEAGNTSLMANLAAMRRVINKHYPLFAGHIQRLNDEGCTDVADRWEATCKDLYKALVDLDNLKNAQAQTDGEDEL